MCSHGPSLDQSAASAAEARIADERRRTAIDLQERERLRIAFDLHDGPAQTMSAALLQVRMLQDVEADRLPGRLDELRSTLATALDEIYALIENLGGRESKDAGLVSRVRAAVAAFTERFGIDVDLSIEGDCGKVSSSLQIATFRIIQEALSNIGRHSGATRARVDLWLSPQEMRCEVSDDGKGFDPEEARTSRSRREPFGLRGMTERARMLDGECVIDSASGHGTRVRVRIPVWQG
jgi:two-component system sensor histidine kinase DegS